MTYILKQNPQITHEDQEVDGLSFESIAEGYWNVTGDQTKINAFVARESATVINEETDVTFLVIMRKIRKNEFSQILSTNLKSIREENTQEEIDSFVIQETEAMAYQADSNAATPFIDNIATARGMDRVTLIGRVMANSTAYRAIVSSEMGKKQKAFDQLDAATSLTAINAVV